MAVCWVLLKKWWWAILLALLGGVALAARVFFGKRDDTAATIKVISSEVQVKVTNADTEALIEKAKADTDSQEQKQKLTEIQQIQDGVERRKKLAALLNLELGQG